MERMAVRAKRQMVAIGCSCARWMPGENGPRDHVSEAQTLLWFNGIDDANWGIQRD